MEQFKWQIIGITLMETKFLYTCQVNCLWIKGCWYAVITDTFKHILYLKHFYTGYQIMVFDQSKFSIFTIKPEMKLDNLWWTVFMKSSSQTGWVNFHFQATLVFTHVKANYLEVVLGKCKACKIRIYFQCNYFMLHCTTGIQISLRLYLSLDANYPFLQVTNNMKI